MSEPPVSDPEEARRRRLSPRVIVPIVAVVALAVVATVVVVATRPSASTGGTSSGNGGGHTTPATQAAKPSEGTDTSAAKLLGWPAPNAVDEFDGPMGSDWNIYDGPVTSATASARRMRSSRPTGS